MNKLRVDKMIPIAYNVLAEKDISEKAKIVDMDNKIEDAFRGQISSFAASVVTGGLLSAVAFYSEQGQAKVPRQELLKAIYIVIQDYENSEEIKRRQIKEDSLFEYISKHPDESSAKEIVLDATIAVKLAMNLFELKKKED